jgi:UDP-N-acetylmuramate dehydrogenase
MIAFHSFTTFGVPATANALIHADTPALLIDALQSAYATNTQWLVLGGGSNLLITQHFSGTIIRNELRGIARRRNIRAYYFRCASRRKLA